MLLIVPGTLGRMWVLFSMIIYCLQYIDYHDSPRSLATVQSSDANGPDHGLNEVTHQLILKLFYIYLQKAFISGEKHQSCISSLKYTGQTSNFQITLAEHLFSPLSGDETLLIGNKCFTGPNRCLTCQDAKPLTVCDTTFDKIKNKYA